MRLRELRLASGKTLDDIEYADIMGKSKMYNIENAKQPKPSWPEIQELARLLGADDDQIRELTRMARACLESTWYVPFDISLGFRSYLDLEEAATQLCFYECAYVNGLFQTLDYMRAIQNSWDLSDLERERAIEFRTQRIQRFWKRKPAPKVVLMMDESCLRRQIGDAETMTEQIVHLRALAERPKVSIYVVPFAAGAHPAMEGKFTLLDFKSGAYPEVAYVESRAESMYHERPTVVALYKQILREVLGRAVPIEEFEL